jgi:uncharacterized protein (DUF362 family)/NAD-dependent dihydropyrimidine dehydrogenase PreA subunit
MDKRVSVRNCESYNSEEIKSLFSDIYSKAGGPDPKGKRVLLKPNILTDDDPRKAISTHPVFVEAAIKFFFEAGASEVLVGDSPSVHTPGFTPKKSGIADVCNKTGATWVNFLRPTREIKLRKGRIKVAEAALEADLLISLPKLKTHELMYLTAAIKNTLGIVPGFNKAAQHALHYDRKRFGNFLVDLNEAVTPSFFMIDGITGMEGPGPGNGIPVHTGVIIGSCNPLAADIIASEITGYNIMDISTNKAALERGLWLESQSEIIYDGPDRKSMVCKNFRKVPVIPDGNMALKFIIHRVRLLRRLEKRPIFNSNNCIGCKACVKICPLQVLSVHPDIKTKILINDNKCIRCFCCSEVCPANAIEVKKKFF